jgi:2-deoxy-D-gluconate 3-dehydrogenase
MMNLFDLTGKVALVTGASRGLGAAMALALAEAGADVAVHASEQPATKTEASIQQKGRNTLCLTANLAKREETARLVPAVIAAFGRLDILVNNAGTIRRKPVAEYPDDWWDEVIEVNLSSVFRLCRAAGAHMIERGGGGKIVNVASLLAFQGGITVPSYAAAKGGVAQLTKAMSNEWAGHRINVNAIAPGYMKTDNTSALRADPVRSRQIFERIPAQRWGEPEDLDGAVVFLSSRASDYINGHVLVVDGGWLGR